MARCGANSSLPLGPSTKILPLSRRTLTPAGTTTGCLPIRDMFAFRLPPRAQELAAQLLGPRPPVAHDSAVGANDADPQAVEHRPELRVPTVQSPSRPAGPIDLPDDALTLRPVLQEDAQDGLRPTQIGNRLEDRRSVVIVSI